MFSRNKVPLPPLDLTTCYSKEVITRGWLPTTPKYPTQIPAKIPPTSEWDSAQLLLLKLHFFCIPFESANPTSSPYWMEYLCPPAEMGEKASALSSCPFSLTDLLEKKHFAIDEEYPGFSDSVAGQFCELLSSMIFSSSESAIDDIVKFLLRSINPAKRDLLIIGQQKEYTVAVGDENFTSIPDVSVIMTPSGVSPEARTSLIVVEDKKSRAAVANAEYQLAGEMLAYTNYYARGIQFDQTIFAIRVVGTNFSFYRAEFPKSYITSLAKGVPPEHITIFRLGSGSGISIALPINTGFYDRMIVIQVLTSVLHAVVKIAHCWDEKKVAPITVKRLLDLAPTRIID